MKNEMPLLVYPKAARELLGVGATTFYELVKMESFPKPRDLIGKRPMYLTSELVNWAESLELGEMDE